MSYNSHHAKFASSEEVRMVRNASGASGAYDIRMPRKAEAKRKSAPTSPDWFLQEWMSTLKISQATLAKECDWTGSTMHGIYHGRTAYYRDIVNLVASKLNIMPYELLMHPAEAMALRAQRDTALKVVEATKSLILPGAESDDDQRKRA